MTESSPLTARPLDGVRILDFTRVLAGPLSTALLADLGAEVVKIEPPQGDDYRAIGPMNNGESALFTVMNRNKQSLVLDLKHPEAVALVHEMAAQADVVVENFRPGVAERLGIGASQLRALNPRLVYVSVSGFGQTGPLAHRPAYDIIVQAMSGLMEATGEPDGAPTVVGEAVSDVVAGLFASWATLAALLQARATGQGQQVDVAMFDTTLSFLATSVARYLFTGRPARRVGNRHPLSAPFGVYRAGDGHFALAVLNNKLFAAALQAMELGSLAGDPRFASDESRSAHEPALREAIEAWAGRHEVAQVVAALDAAGSARRPHLEHCPGAGVAPEPGTRPAWRGAGRAPAGPASAHPARAFQRRRTQPRRARTGPGRAHRRPAFAVAGPGRRSHCRAARIRCPGHRRRRPLFPITLSELP